MKSNWKTLICLSLTPNRQCDNVLWQLLEWKHSEEEEDEVEDEEDEEVEDEEVEDEEHEEAVRNRLTGLQWFSNLIAAPCLSSRKGNNQHHGEQRSHSQLRQSISTTLFQVPLQKGRDPITS